MEPDGDWLEMREVCAGNGKKDARAGKPEPEVHQENEKSDEDEMWSPVEVVQDEDGGGGAEGPCARAKHAAALAGRYLYVLGGRGAGGNVPLRDCWRYHLTSGRWFPVRARGETPPALQEHTATAHAHSLYVFGGEAALSAETPLWILDTETLLWRKLPGGGGGGGSANSAWRRGRGCRTRLQRAAAPSGRRGHSAHALNDCLLIYGGYKDLRGSTNELWAFHYESESWQQVRTATAGPARHRHAAALHDARLYVHAGQCDLRACQDLWYYDTLSRTWTLVRTVARLSPGPRCGHAGLRLGNYFYIFGGEADGHPTNELWRFHFATETWERMATSLKWPAPRVDACALLLDGVTVRVRAAAADEQHAAGCGRTGPGAGAGAGAGAEGAGLLREISKLSSFRLRRAARCSYSALAADGDRDSTESLALAKSRSAYAIERGPPAGARGNDAAAVPELPRDRASVPDFADVSGGGGGVPARLVLLDSDSDTAPAAATDGGEGELSTSDYASAEGVNRLAGAWLGFSGFSNPHYLGPDVRALGIALTPDSGVAATDLELTELRRPPVAAPSPTSAPRLLVVGGREPPHLARLTAPLSLWTYSPQY